MQTKFPGRILPYILFVPSVIISILFLYYPALQTFMLSFHKTAFFGRKTLYVGWENFSETFTSLDYLNTVWVSLVFSAGVVILGLVISLVTALLVNQTMRFKRIYVMILLLPYALSPVIAGIIWLFLFNPTVGIINYFLDLFFGVEPDWIGQRYLALTMVIVTAVWKNFGYNLVFVLAGLQNIPGEVLEAAEMDGASPLRRLWEVTLPLLSPILFFLVVMNSIYSFFGTFGIIDIMTKGAPLNSTNIMIYNLYRTAFIFNKSGLAATQSVILFALVAGLTLLQFRASRERVFYLGG